MEIHQLQYVVQLAKHLNFSRAADELCITQPTLSHQLAKLETELGVSLFERKTRSVKITAAGKAFAEQADKILSDLSALHASMLAYQSCTTGEISIGILPLTGDYGLTTYLPAFQRQYPGVRIRLAEAAGSHELVKMLLAGTIDAAWMIPQANRSYDHRLLFYPIIQGQVVLIAAKNHPLTKKGLVNLSDAADELFIFPPATHSIHAVALEACRQNGFEPKIACECSQLNTVFDLVAKGLGISFVSSQVIGALLPDAISPVFFSPRIDRALCLAMLDSKRPSPIAALFRDFMLSEKASAANLSRQP